MNAISTQVTVRVEVRENNKNTTTLKDASVH